MLARWHQCPCLNEKGLREEKILFTLMGTSFLNVFENSNLYQELHFVHDQASLGYQCWWLWEQQGNTMAQLAATISTGTCCLSLITVHSLWAWSDPSACAPCAADMEQPCSSGPSSHSPLGATDQ